MVSARTAVFVVFALNGCALGSWAPRVPALTEQVGAVPGSLGLALLGASVGLLLAATVTGRLVESLGARLVMALSTVAAALVLAALGLTTSVLWLGLTLFALGAAIGVLDVSMNVAAVFVEREAGKPLMPVFHAGFSFGALAGALFAGLAASNDWSPARQFLLAAAVAIMVLFAVVKALPGSNRTTRPARSGPRRCPRSSGPCCGCSPLSRCARRSPKAAVRTGRRCSWSPSTASPRGLPRSLTPGSRLPWRSRG